jgi:hypothetical protein
LEKKIESNKTHDRIELMPPIRGSVERHGYRAPETHPDAGSCVDCQMEWGGDCVIWDPLNCLAHPVPRVRQGAVGVVVKDLHGNFAAELSEFSINAESQRILTNPVEVDTIARLNPIC